MVFFFLFNEIVFNQILGSLFLLNVFILCVLVFCLQVSICTCVYLLPLEFREECVPPLELELWMAMSLHVLIGTKLRSSGGAASALNC